MGVGAHLAGAVDGARDAQVGGVVELATADLALVPRQRVHSSTSAHIPHLHCVVEAARDYTLALSVEVQRDDLCGVAQQRVQALARLYVPQA